MSFKPLWWVLVALVGMVLMGIPLILQDTWFNRSLFQNASGEPSTLGIAFLIAGIILALGGTIIAAMKARA